MAKRMRLAADELRRVLDLLVQGGALERQGVGELLRLVEAPPMPGLGAPAPEEPPFCAGCAFRHGWLEKRQSLLGGYPLDGCDARMIELFRFSVGQRVEDRLREQADAVLAALGVPTDQDHRAREGRNG